MYNEAALALPRVVAERDTQEMETAVAAFIREIKYLRGLSPETVNSYISAIRAFLRYAGVVYPRDITLNAVHNWSEHLATIGISTGARSTYLVGIRQFCIFLNRSGLITVDPRDIIIPKRHDAPRRFVTKEQVDKMILAAGSYRDKAIVSLLFTSGIRCNELVNLNIDDIKGDEFVVKGKGGKVRPCYLSDLTAHYLRLYLAQRDTVNPALFIGTRKRLRLSDTQIRKIVREVGELAGIYDAHPHMLRHGFATHLLNNGCDIESLRKLMGHSQISTTQRYLHVLDKGLRETHHKYF